ncbi:MAG TPA: nuclear transport factor 2 family protein [Terriglobales bacterium]|nr:nuclear transport factor 2 family protein [Terriglobales bacterium]
MSSAANPYEDAEVVIWKLSEQWMRDWNAGDLDKVVDLYAKDALYLPAHDDPIHGRARIREFLRGSLEKGASDFTLQIDFIQRAGDLAYDVGRYAVSLHQDDGSRKRDRGRYLVVWQRQAAGDWRMLVFAAWSSEEPRKQ